jgi:hypothetical protein
MEDQKEYNIWNALIHELLLAVFDIKPSLRHNSWIKKILEWTRPDWVLWKVEQTMLDVSKQAELIVKEWEKNEPPKYQLIEHPPDGSKAQELLGGAIEIKSNWRKD